MDEHYDPLPRASKALQFEFGVDGNDATGFLDRAVLCGVLLGPWAKDSVADTVAENLRTHSTRVSRFLTDHDEYRLITKTETLGTPIEDDIERVSHDLDGGFAITRDLELTELPGIDVVEPTFETLADLTPQYRLLAGIDDASLPPVETPKETTGTSPPPAAEWDIESLSAATTLDEADVEDSVDRLISEGCSVDEAIYHPQ